MSSPMPNPEVEVSISSSSSSSSLSPSPSSSSPSLTMVMPQVHEDTMHVRPPVRIPEVTRPLPTPNKAQSLCSCVRGPEIGRDSTGVRPQIYLSDATPNVPASAYSSKNKEYIFKATIGQWDCLLEAYDKYCQSSERTPTLSFHQQALFMDNNRQSLQGTIAPKFGHPGTEPDIRFLLSSGLLLRYYLFPPYNMLKRISTAWWFAVLATDPSN